MNAIEMKGVRKTFGDITAVDGLDLDVPAGICLGLLGPNGAGKSTSMRLLTGQAIADEGEITVLGHTLPAEAKVAVDKLSGGMRRRLLLARGLVHEPRLVLLDEPTVGLDPQIRTELWTLIGELKARGTTILMSTHYIEEAERLADEVAVMHRGKIISRGRPADLIAEHAGRQTAEVYAPPERLSELRTQAETAGLRVRPAGPAIA